MKTEGVKYAGSKNKLIPHILDAVKSLRIGTVLDGFSGTTRVAQAFKALGCTVIANDTAVWSRIFGECYLVNRRPQDDFVGKLEYLNNLPGKDGWFTEHYGGAPNNGSSVQSDGKKRVWQNHNTKKLDAIREEIDRISSDPIERSVLLTSLINALDKVDSSLGHHVSYLRNWSPRSYKTMKLICPAFIVDHLPHQALNASIFDIVQDTSVDLAYFDPPYGSSNEKMPPSRVRYASYYHLWKTIILNDQPELVGAANRRADAGDRESASEFEDYRRGISGKYAVVEAIERLLANTRAKYILLSYSSGGRATFEELVEVIRGLKYQYKVTSVDHSQNVMSKMTWTNDWTTFSSGFKEYIFLIRR